MRQSLKLNLVLLNIAFLLLVQLSSISCLPVFAQEHKLLTLREAVKSGRVKLKLNGDCVSTANVSLQLTNTTAETVKIVIPANESLKPNNQAVQTMLITRDMVVTLMPGKTSIFTVETVCASPKSISPPPPVTEGLDFEVADYSDPELWKKLSRIIAAGKELETAGAFGNLLYPSENALNEMIEEEVKKERDEKIKLLIAANSELSRAEAEKIIDGQIELIKDRAEKKIRSVEKKKQRNELTQLAIWRVLGIESQDSKDEVSPESIEKDILKELSEQIKMDKTLLSKLGGKLAKDGTFIPTKSQKKALEDKTSLIFEVVNLTVNRSGEKGLHSVAALPSDDPCLTFCNVGERAFKQGDYAEAQELLTSALEEAEQHGEADPRLSRCLDSLGMCYLDMTSYDKAESLLKRALSLREKVFGAESKEVGETSNNLGLANQQQEKYLPAESLFERAASILGKTVGKTSNSVAEALNNLGRNHNLQEQASEAKMPLTRALSFAIINSPKDLKGNSLYTPFVAEVETNLGDTYVQLGDYERASALYKKALLTNQKQLGEFHPFLAKALDGLADASEKSGNDSDAESFRKKAELIRSRSLGDENRELAMLPLGYDAFTRIKNFVDGKKELSANVDSLRAAAAVVSKRTSDKRLVNKPIKDKWALVVGISEFKDPSINLQYAAKDAKDFAKYLVDEANFAPDHVRLLVNQQATREEIMAQIGDKWLPRVANPDDLVVIFFSSHGSPTQMDVNSVNYLVAHNTDTNSLYATGIPLQQFTDTIKNRVHSERVVVVMDACHSGAAIGAKGIFRNFGVDANQVAQGTGQMVICSSSANQTSWESVRYKNGVFTHHLIDSLRNSDKLGEAFDRLRSKVQEEVQMDRNGEVQSPVLQSKWVGDDLIIKAPPLAPRPGLAAN